jgi:hypothetical protein
LKLDLEVIGPEEVDHPRDPPLLLRQFIRVVRLNPSPPAVHPSSSSSSSSPSTTSACSSRLLLVLDENRAHPKHARDILRRLDDSLVLEDRGDDRVRYRSTRRERLGREKRNVGRESKKSEDRCVGPDWGEEEREQVRRCRGGVEVGAERFDRLGWLIGCNILARELRMLTSQRSRGPCLPQKQAPGRRIPVGPGSS